MSADMNSLHPERGTNSAAGNKKRGLLIVIEGIDGCGKTTQLRLLKKHITENGGCAFITSEPTCKATHRPTAAGVLIRDALRGVSKYSDSALGALFLADRIMHNTDPETGIRRMLEGGTDVVCARYYYSSVVYQGNSENYDWVLRANFTCPEITRPDLCVFLDINPDVCLSRIENRHAGAEIYERDTSMLREARRKYLELFDTLQKIDPAQNIHVIDAARPVSEIADDIFKLTAALR